jgi:uncharacterized protein YkwD
MHRPAKTLDLWPWAFRLWVALVLFVLLRPPVLLLWNYGLRPAADQSTADAEQAKKDEPMRPPQVDGATALLNQPTMLGAARPPILRPLEKAIFDLALAERGPARPTLTDNPDLADLAAYHSRHMRDLGFFAHAAPDGTGPAERVGRALRGAFGTVAENIAKITASPDQPDLARTFVEDWMNSPGHRANILDSGHTDLGVGCSEPGVGQAQQWTHCAQVFMAVYARLRQPFPETVGEGEAIDLEVVPANGNPPATRIRQASLRTGAVAATADLTEQNQIARGKLEVEGPAGLYRLELEIPDPKTQGRTRIVPGPYFAVK